MTKEASVFSSYKGWLGIYIVVSVLVTGNHFGAYGYAWGVLGLFLYYLSEQE